MWKSLQKHITLFSFLFHHDLIKAWHLQRADTTPDSSFKVSAEQTSKETSFSIQTRSRHAFASSFLHLAEQTHWFIFHRGQRTGFSSLWDTGAIKPYIAALNPRVWFRGPVLPKSRALGRTRGSEGTQMEMRQSSRGVHAVLCCAVLCQVSSVLQNATATSLLLPFSLCLM